MGQTQSNTFGNHTEDTLNAGYVKLKSKIKANFGINADAKEKSNEKVDNGNRANQVIVKDKPDQVIDEPFGKFVDRDTFDDIAVIGKYISVSVFTSTINNIYNKSTFDFYTAEDVEYFTKKLFELIKRTRRDGSRAGSGITNKIFIHHLVSIMSFAKIMDVRDNDFDRSTLIDKLIEEILKIKHTDTQLEDCRTFCDDIKYDKYMTEAKETIRRITKYLFILFQNFDQLTQIFSCDDIEEKIEEFEHLSTTRLDLLTQGQASKMKHINPVMWKNEFIYLINAMMGDTRKYQGKPYGKADLCAIGNILFIEENKQPTSDVCPNEYDGDAITYLLCEYIKSYFLQGYNEELRTTILQILKCVNPNTLNKQKICSTLLSNSLHSNHPFVLNQIYQFIGDEGYDEELFLTTAKSYITNIFGDNLSPSSEVVRKNFGRWFVNNMRRESVLERDGVIELFDTYLANVSEKLVQITYLVKQFILLDSADLHGRYVLMFLSHNFKIGKENLKKTITKLPRIFMTNTGISILANAIDYYGDDIICSKTRTYFVDILEKLQQKRLDKLSELLEMTTS